MIDWICDYCLRHVSILCWISEHNKYACDWCCGESTLTIATPVDFVTTCAVTERNSGD